MNLWHDFFSFIFNNKEYKNITIFYYNKLEDTVGFAPTTDLRHTRFAVWLLRLLGQVPMKTSFERTRLKNLLVRVIGFEPTFSPSQAERINQIFPHSDMYAYEGVLSQLYYPRPST